MSFKKLAFPFLFLIMFTFSCQEEVASGPACEVENPVRDLGWLADIAKELDNSGLRDVFYISQAQYKSKPVFAVQNCCAFCNTSPPPVYDCEGKQIGFIGSGKGDIDPDILENSIIVWKTEGFTCAM
jgi:hypothetical protein